MEFLTKCDDPMYDLSAYMNDTGDEEDLTPDFINECVAEARDQLLLLNTRESEESEEDE